MDHAYDTVYIHVQYDTIRYAEIARNANGRRISLQRETKTNLNNQ